MARTPLLDLLQRAVRQHARAEYEDRHGRSGLKRRDVLRGGAGLAIASMVPVSGLAATARIAVVGAGLAGLTAARDLKKANLMADILEGDTRVGGRCYTGRGKFNEGQTVERGGEFIDDDHHQIKDLTADLRLTLDDVLAATPANTRELYFFDGKPYNLAEATRDWAPKLYDIVQRQKADIVPRRKRNTPTPEARRLDAMTISQWVEAYVTGGRRSRLGQLIETALAEENGADADQQSALSVISALGENARNDFKLYYNVSNQRWHVHGGNDQIVSFMADELKGRIETSTALVAIAQLPDRTVRLSLKRGGQIVDRIYDRVILALPFSVMRARVDYKQAGFRPLKQKAIQTLPIGASTKFQMQFTRRIWNEDGCNGEIRVPSRVFQTSWEATRKQDGTSGILNFFSGGTRALNAGKIDNVDLAQEVLRDAAHVLPNLGQYWTGRMIKDAWRDNPWSLGGYSYYQPGYQTTVLGVEPLPEGNCFFAGEHTDTKSNAFLNSAVASGQRAAQEVIASLR
ncbi:MAG TPA: FAD-dependent oxidoreductase [Reyranella sp.]|nr:FAD-dependent oxidoreductase [Reyranella sp.]